MHLYLKHKLRLIDQRHASRNIFTSSIVHMPLALLRHNNNSQAPRLPYNTPCNPLQTQPAQPRLAVLNLRNLIDMLQGHCPHRAQHRIPNRRTTRARLALLAIVVVHRPRHIPSAADLALCWRNARGAEEEGCSGWCAQLEVEGAVGADGDARGDRSAGVVVGGAGVELLLEVSICVTAHG